MAVDNIPYTIGTEPGIINISGTIRYRTAAGFNSQVSMG